MADEKNTVHTVYTAEANLKAAEAELREFSSKFKAVFDQMAAMTKAADENALKMARSYNKAIATFSQARNNLQGAAVTPDRLGARSRNDIKAEAASRAGDLDEYRRKVSRALAGTALEIDERIKELNAKYDKMAKSRRQNHRRMAELDAELDTLRKRSSTIRSNPYVAEQLSGARSARMQAQLKQAAADDRFAAKAAEELAAAKMRLATVEGILSTKRGRDTGRTQALTQEQAKLTELIRSYESMTAVVQKYNQNYGKNIGKELSQSNRQMVKDARQVLELEERTAVIKAQIVAGEAAGIRLNATQLAALRTELEYSQQLLNLHRQDADLMARVTKIRDRAANQSAQASLAAARADAVAMNKDIDRIAKKTEADRLRAKGLDDYTQRQAKADNAEFTRIKRKQDAFRELDRQKKLGIDNATQAQAKADNDEFTRLTRKRRLLEESNRQQMLGIDKATQAQAQADNAEFDRIMRMKRLRERRNDPGVAASNFIKNEETRLRIEAQILRLKQSGTTEDRVQITLLDQELIRLRQEADQLMRIAGIESRISVERAKRASDPKSDTRSRLQSIRQNPGELMGIQAELMGNYAAFGAIQSAVQNMVTYVIQGETALAKFQAIASASNIETAAMAASMEELGSQSRYTNLEIIDTATLLAQAGLSARDAGPALRAVAELATAAGIELRQAADVVTSVSNIWGYSTSEMGNVADILTAALNKTKLSMDQMQLGIQYAGNIAVDAGVDFVELTAAMGALAQAGIRSGSTIGTGLRALITDLQSPNEKMVATMERLGLTMEDVNLRTLGLTQVLHNLKQAGFTSADALRAFEVRAAASFTAISNNLNVLDDLQTDLYGTNAAAVASAIQMETLSAKWTSFVNIMQTVAKDGFAPVIAVVKIFLGLGTSLLRLLDDFPQVTAAVTAGLVTLFSALAVTKLTLAVNAMLGMIATAGGLGTALFGASAGATALGISLMGIPIIGWIAGAAALAAMIYSWTKNMGDAGDTADQLAADINDISSRMQTNRQVTQALDGAVNRLNRQYGILVENSAMRERTLDQTRMRFQALGLQVDDSTNSVEGMIQAIDRLKDALNEEFGAQLFALAAKMRLEVEELEDRNMETGGISDEARDATRSAYNRFRQLNGGPGNDLAAMGGAVERSTNTVLWRQPLQDSDRPRIAGDINTLNVAASTIQRRIDNNNTNPRQRAADQARLNFINNLIFGLGQALESLNAVVQRRTEALDTADEARYRSMLADPSTEVYNFSRSIDIAMRNRYAGRVQEITSSDASAGEKVRQADILGQEVRAFELELIQRSEAIATRLPASMQAKFIEEMGALISAAVQDTIMTRFDTIRDVAENEEQEAGAEGAGNRSRDAAQAAAEALAEARQDALQAALDQAQRERTMARTTEEWERADAEYKRIMPLLQERRIAAFEAELQNEEFYDANATHVRPADGPTISRMQGRRTVNGVTRAHEGIDIDGEQGDSVRSATAGRVQNVDHDPGGWGNYIRVTNDDGTTSLYAHLSRVDVQEGQRVDRAAQIGLMGGQRGTPGAGNSTGSHLHYELRGADGVLIDPDNYVGSLGPGAGQSADFNEIRTLRRQQVEAEMREEAMAAERAAQRQRRKIEFVPLQRNLRSRARTNNASIDATIAALETGGTEDAMLSEVIDAVRAKVEDNFRIASDLLRLDPENEERIGTADFEEQIVNEQVRVMLEGADKLDAAYEAYRAVQARLAAEDMAFVDREAERAGAAGTSETTVWLLEQRRELEMYQAAQRELLANQVIYAEALQATAAAQFALAASMEALNAAVGPEAIAQAEGAVAVAQQGLTRAQQSQNAAAVRVTTAQQGVTAATPLNPISTQAATATAAGSNWMTNPGAALTGVMDRFKQVSGIMASMSQTITSGIEASFDALTQGINDSIMQLGDGTLTIRGLFSNLLGGILKEMQQTAAKIATNWIMQWLVRTLMSQFAGPSIGGGSMDAQGMSMLNRKHGGMTPGTPKRFALGGGSGQPGRDSVHGLLEPGEITMRKSAVDFIGADKLLELNALGNRRLSEATAKVPMMAPREPDQVNVWLAAPGQVPPPSKKDIVLMVGESMANGELKKLVKQVAVGG